MAKNRGHETKRSIGIPNGLLLLFAMGLICCLTAVSVANAQTYPARPIKILVPYAAGGSVDFVARVVAQGLSQTLGQAVIVENRPGGATNIAADAVAKAEPDGYTLFAASRANAVNTALGKGASANIQKDFEQIGLLAEIPNLLVVSPALGVKNVDELVALAKAQPGRLTFASAGSAGSTHLAGELFANRMGINIVHVPYRGGSPAAVDLMSGQVSMYFATMPSVMSYVRAGKLQGLAVTSLNRSKTEPQYPSLDELGLKGFRETSWVGLVAPAGTPVAIISTLSAAVIKVLAQTETRAQLNSQGAEVLGGSPQDFVNFLASDIANTADIIKKAKIVVE
jgi:tripartite-type tricarboxylate transporter receptor subunit TctC